MSEFLELPRRARAWIAAVWLTALVLVAIQLPSVATWNAQDAAAWFALSAVANVYAQAPELQVALPFWLARRIISSYSSDLTKGACVTTGKVS